VEEIQQGWPELKLKLDQLETRHAALEHDHKALRSLLERVIEHRQKSHGELVLLLTGLVSKLPINDVGVIVTRLMEHNTHVSEILAALVKGKADTELPQPTILKALDQTKRDLVAAARAAVEELAKLDTPLDTEVLRSLIEQPERFFSPKVVRASRCYVKGLVPRERIVRTFGEAALPLFNDTTTDPKLNPRPKPEEIALAFKPDFETLLPQQTALAPEKQQALRTLYAQVQRSKAATDEARAQRDAYARLSFVLDLLHYYENQNTEAVDVVFAQRLPALIEQLALPGQRKKLEEPALVAAEGLLAVVLNPEHRLMIVNNVGKAGGPARTVKYVLRLRLDQATDFDQMVHEFVRHLLPSPPQKAPSAQTLAAVLRLVPNSVQSAIVRAIRSSDRLPKEQAQALAQALAAELALTGLEEQPRPVVTVPPEVERQMAWDGIKDLIKRRSAAATIAAAIRDRLHAKYDADELRQSWITLIEADAVALIRIFCQLPYREDGKTDPIAHMVMQTYLSRLMHDKYAAVYHKVVTSLKNMFKAKPDSPTLLNFLALVKWADAEAARKLSADIGLGVHAA
jgi:hypothetical protein